MGVGVGKGRADKGWEGDGSVEPDTRAGKFGMGEI